MVDTLVNDISRVSIIFQGYVKTIIYKSLSVSYIYLLTELTKGQREEK